MIRAIRFFLNYLWGPPGKFFIYHLRWQMGFVLLPIMYLLLDYFKFPYWLSLILFNFCGAFIYFPIDKYIFNVKAKEREERQDGGRPAE